MDNKSKIITIIKTNPLYTVLAVINIFAIILYCYTLYGLNFPDSIEAIAYSTPDSVCYKEAGETIFSSTVSETTSHRTFLYPLIHKVATSLFGINGIWIFQFIFWIVGINSLFLAIYKLTLKLVYSVIGSVIYIVNFSFIELSLHALTDVTSISVLSITIYFVIRNYQKIKSSNFILIFLLLISVLTVIKPLYFPLFLLILFVIIPLGYFKALIIRKKNILLLILAIMPVILQFALVKIKHDKFSLSTAGSITLKYYYFSKGYSIINNIDLNTARQQVVDYDKVDMFNYVMQNKKIFFEEYITNIICNIKADPFYCSHNKLKNTTLKAVMKSINSVYYYLHLVMAIPIMIFLVYLIRKKDQLIILVCGLLVFMLMLVATTGIAFWQGDRYVLHLAPIWIVLYILFFSYIINKKHQNLYKN